MGKINKANLIAKCAFDFWTDALFINGNDATTRTSALVNLKTYQQLTGENNLPPRPSEYEGLEPVWYPDGSVKLERLTQ